MWEANSAKMVSIAMRRDRQPLGQRAHRLLVLQLLEYRNFFSTQFE